jgi:hypothetical protein
MTDKERDIEKGKVINDQKDAYRLEQIAMEGNDPAKQDNPTDVEESLQNLKQEIQANGKVGRPREGNTYKKDKHPYGRDPLGDKERTDALKHTTTERMADKYVNGVAAKRKYLHENLRSMLDESNIIDENNQNS